MKETSYSEIHALKELYMNHKICISVSDSEFLAGNINYPSVILTLGENSFKLFVDDEYKDLSLKNPLLTLCVVLRELESYAHASDYLVWCRYNGLDASNIQVREYHMSLASIYYEIEKMIGEINSQISDLDFELDAGAAHELRKII